MYFNIGSRGGGSEVSVIHEANSGDHADRVEVVSTGEEHGEDVVRSDASGCSSGDAGVVLDFESFFPGLVELPSEASSRERVSCCQASSSMSCSIELVIQDFKALSVEQVKKPLRVSCCSSHVSNDSSIGGIRRWVSSIALRVNYEHDTKEIAWYRCGRIVATHIPP